MAFGYTAATISGLNPAVNDVTSMLMQNIKTYLTGTLGWTLTEDRTNAAEKKIVLQSAGEDGTASTFYLVLTSGTTNIGIQAATAWSTSTHSVPASGVVSPSLAGTVTITTGPGATTSRILHYWISGDKDSVTIVTRYGGNYDASHIGLIRALTTPANDPFPVYVIGGSSQTPATVANTSSSAYSFQSSTVDLGSGEVSWDALFTTPIGVDQSPDNIFGATEKFIAIPIVAGVNATSPTRKSVRGFSKNVWGILGSTGTSLTPEDIFTTADGKTYQVFFDGFSVSNAFLIRRS